MFTNKIWFQSNLVKHKLSRNRRRYRIANSRKKNVSDVEKRQQETVISCKYQLADETDFTAYLKHSSNREKSIEKIAALFTKSVFHYGA